MTAPDRPHDWRRYYFLGWAPIFAIAIGAFRASGVSHTWSSALIDAAVYLGPAMMLGLLVQKSVHWSPQQKTAGAKPKLRRMLFHTTLSLGFALAWQIIFLALIWAMAGSASVRKTVQVYQPFWQIATGMLIYELLAGIFRVEDLSRKLREKEVAAARAESLRVRAEMAALRGQLDPHFLFNTLHSITALVREDARRAEDALIQFAAMLRHVLELKRENGDELPLAKEMAFVDDYLALEQLRLGERLKVFRSIAPEALDYWVPAFSLQPLVENAIRHALAPRREGGAITLEARVAKGRLTIVVSDNGPGAEPASLAEKDGIGLSALRQRLFLRHGESAHFQITTAPGQGFRVSLELPAVHEAVIESV